MKRIIALSLAISAGAAMALASDSENNPVLDKAPTLTITQTLADEGYTLIEAEAEDGGYEAYAMKDGTKWEVEFDADLNIVETEADDD